MKNIPIGPANLIMLVLSLCCIFTIMPNGYARTVGLSAENVAFENTSSPISLLGISHIWVDESNQATLGNVFINQADAFEPWDTSPKIINEKTGTLWLKISIPALDPQTAARWALYFDSHRIEELSIYQVDSNTTLSSIKIGRFEPLVPEFVSGFGLLVPLNGYAVPTTLLISAKSDTPATFEPRLIPVNLLKSVNLNIPLLVGFFPLAMLLVWALFITQQRITHSKLSRTTLCLGPIFVLHTWVYSPTSYHGQILGFGWVWQKAIFVTPIALSILFTFILKNLLEKKSETPILPILFPVAFGLHGIGLLSVVIAPQPFLLMISWGILLISITSCIIFLKPQINGQIDFRLTRLGIALWAPTAVIELIHNLSLMNLPSFMLLTHGIIALSSAILLFIQIDKNNTNTNLIEKKKLTQHQRALAQSLKSMEFNLQLKHRYFQKVYDDIHEQLKELESIQKNAHLPDISQTSLNHLASLALDIQRFCEIESGCLKQNDQSFDIKKLIIELVETHARMANHKGITFNSKVCSKLPDVLIGDPGILSQLLSQLLDNAIKFTVKGGVSIKFKVKENRQGAEADMMVTITIEDTGPGLPSSTLSQFYGQQEPQDKTSEVKVGLGVGLTTARQMVELMQGDISLRSSSKGTVCEVNIPMKTEVSSTQPSNAQSAPVETKPQQTNPPDQHPKKVSGL